MYIFQISESLECMYFFQISVLFHVYVKFQIYIPFWNPHYFQIHVLFQVHIIFQIRILFSSSRIFLKSAYFFHVRVLLSNPYTFSNSWTFIESTRIWKKKYLNLKMVCRPEWNKRIWRKYANLSQDGQNWGWSTSKPVKTSSKDISCLVSVVWVASFLVSKWRDKNYTFLFYLWETQ